MHRKLGDTWRREHRPRRPLAGDPKLDRPPSGVVLAGGLRLHGRAQESGLLEDCRDLGICHELPVVLHLPIEGHPHPAGVIGIAEDVGALGPVLLSLLGALGREGLQELTDAGDLGSGQDHLSSSVG
jgi:hypothetical protein